MICNGTLLERAQLYFLRKSFTFGILMTPYHMESNRVGVQSLSWGINNFHPNINWSLDQSTEQVLFLVTAVQLHNEQRKTAIRKLMAAVHAS